MKLKWLWRSTLMLVLFFCSGGLMSYGQNPFITVWKTDDNTTDNSGMPLNLSADDQIQIPAAGTFSYVWHELDEDGNVTANSDSGTGTDVTTLTFPHPGLYQLKMTPSGTDPFHQISFIPGIMGDPGKILEVKQWGAVQWSSFVLAFAGTKNLQITANDTPDLDQVTDMTSAFWRSGIEEVSQMNNWDVSHVENMSGLFRDASGFNSPIGDWEVGQVTDMFQMFSNDTAFNQPIDDWDVGEVTDMTGMFHGAKHFNQPIGDWDVGQVTTMENMFSLAASFNQPIGDWDVSSVTSMFATFLAASAFDQPIGGWDVGQVTTMAAMFFGAENFNQPLDNWNVGNVKDMGSMFGSALSFNHPLENWDVSSVQYMNFMFSNAGSFNQDISTWDVSHVATMHGMFSYAIFNLPIDDWDVSQVEDMGAMFAGNSYFNRPLENWEVSGVTDMSNMFHGAVRFNQPLDAWDVSGVYNMAGIFHRAASFNQALPDWNLKHLIYTDSIIDEEGAQIVCSFSFAYSGMSCENYSKTLQGWANNPETSSHPLILLAHGMKYSPEVIPSRDSLEENFNWTINGDTEGSCALGVNRTQVLTVKVYPNPTHDFIQIEGSRQARVVLLDIQGHQLLFRPVASPVDRLYLKDFPGGVYFLKISDARGNAVLRKIIKE